MKKMRFFLVTFFLFAFAAGFAQDDKKSTAQEMGLKIVMKDPKADPASYIQAAKGYWYYDQFRFLNERRELPFEDGKAVLVLYSANEMWTNSKKQVSPLTLKDGVSYQEYRLAIAIDGNSVKPMPTGSWLKR
jgi:hypothetical protein